jgi:hypothetical protein
MDRWLCLDFKTISERNFAPKGPGWAFVEPSFRMAGSPCGEPSSPRPAISSKVSKSFPLSSSSRA